MTTKQKELLKFLKSNKTINCDDLYDKGVEVLKELGYDEKAFHEMSYDDMADRIGDVLGVVIEENENGDYFIA